MKTPKTTTSLTATTQDKKSQEKRKIHPDDIKKFWDYAGFIDADLLVSQQDWFSFTCIHKNIVRRRRLC